MAATSSAADSAASCEGALAADPAAEPRRRGAATTATDSTTATATLAALATDASHGGAAGAKHSRKVVVAEVARGLHAPLAALLLGPQLRGDTFAFCLEARPLCAQLRDAGTSGIDDACGKAARGARAATATPRR